MTPGVPDAPQRRGLLPHEEHRRWSGSCLRNFHDVTAIGVGHLTEEVDLRDYIPRSVGGALKSVPTFLLMCGVPRGVHFGIGKKESRGAHVRVNLLRDNTRCLARVLRLKYSVWLLCGVRPC